MSRPMPILLIRKIFEQNYTTSQVEEYFGKKWNILQQELEEFLKDQPCAGVKLKEILSQIKKNDVRKLGFEREL